MFFIGIFSECLARDNIQPMLEQKPLSRQLETVPQMAALKPYEKFAEMSSATWMVLPPIADLRQSFFGIRRRAEQQDQGHSQKSIRTTRWAVPPSENPYLHAQGYMKWPTLLREDLTLMPLVLKKNNTKGRHN